MDTKDCLKQAAGDVVRAVVSVPLIYSLAVAAAVERVGELVFGVPEKMAGKENGSPTNSKK